MGIKIKLFDANTASGHAMKVGVFGDGLMSSSVCTSCGQCVATCPTGALRPKEIPAPIDDLFTLNPALIQQALVFSGTRVRYYA